MWVRETDDTVRDESGKLVYFSLERFVRDVCLGDCCFICGARPTDVPFNDEHVIPDWILRRYDLFAQSVTLPNGTSFRYDRYKVPCCAACNSRMGDVIEKPIRELIDDGYDAVNAYQGQHGILKFYVWMGLTFLKTHLKDRTLRAHLDARKGTVPLAEDLRYDWARLHYLHTLIRCFATDAEIHPTALGSFVAIRVQQEPNEQPFDFGDLYSAQTIMLRLGDLAFLAAFNDAGGAAQFLKQRLGRITGPVSSIQLRELAAELAFLNVHLKEHPELTSSFDLKQKRHRIMGKPVLPELLPLDYAVRGKLMHYLFKSNLGNMKSYTFSEAELEQQMLAGRLTFLFDANGAFFKDSNAVPPTR